CMIADLLRHRYGIRKWRLRYRPAITWWTDSSQTKCRKRPVSPDHVEHSEEQPDGSGRFLSCIPPPGCVLIKPMKTAIHVFCVSAAIVLPLLSLIAGAADKASKGDYIAYIGTYTGKSSKGIYAFRFDASTGKLTPLGLAA